MAILNNSNAISSGGYDINNSLRFRSSASAYLNRTPASASNQQKWTWSGWVKKSAITKEFAMFGCTPTTNGCGFGFGNTGNTSDQFFFTVAGVGTATTTAVFRDPSAWYHVVFVLDTTQATAANRSIVYINNVQYTLSTNLVTLNSSLLVNSVNSHLIGITNGVGVYADGYMTDINFIDGQALTPSSFGETDTTTGSWKPKAYTGTYGTNGYYLKFSDIATTSGSNAGLGKDFSGNGNYWTTNNISVTAGTTYDAMTDSPTLTSATVANYAVMNPLWTDGTVSITQGNLNVSSGNYGGFSTLTIPTNSKFYAEFTVTATQGNQGVGILKAANAYSGVIGQTDMFGSNSVTYYCVNGNKFVLGGGSTAYGSSWGTVGDVIGIAVDTVNNQITFYKNNTSQGVITGLTSGIEWVFATGNQTSTGGGSWNFGQRPFSYSPPSGFVALNTYNLPTPTILQGNKYMDATLYTGNGSTQVVVNQAPFKPDFVWIKRRDATASHALIDSVRGISNQLVSNLTNAEATGCTDGITALNSNGFSLGAGTLGYVTNNNGATLVGWQWQAGQGTNTTNTAGTITSTVSVNATAGFSVVNWTGSTSTSAQTVGHGLGVAPKMVILKNRNLADNWFVFLSGITSTSQNLYLNTTAALTTQASALWGAGMTSTVCGVRPNSFVNTSSDNVIMYCWAEIAGFSKFGSYTGNGSSDGPFVYLGFRPKFIIAKSATNAYYWYIRDSTREPSNVVNDVLLAQSSAAEELNNAAYDMDFLSNGFKLRNAYGGINNSGDTFIFMAFAENPFRNSLAR